MSVHSTSRSDVYYLNLNQDEVETIMGATATSLICEGHEVNRSNFGLPDDLENRLQEASDQVYSGLGISVIHGLKPPTGEEGTGWSASDATIALLGLSERVGGRLRGVQDVRGNILTDVINMDSPVSEEDLIGTRHTAKLPPKTDIGPYVLCLHVRDVAKQGGELCTSRVKDIWETMKTRYQDDAKTLTEPKYPVELIGQKGMVLHMPMIYVGGDEAAACFDPGRLRLRDCVDAQVTALDKLITSAEEMSIVLGVTPGDIVFINNLKILYSLRGYIDDKKAQSHLARLWLSRSEDEPGFALPPIFRPYWESCFGANGNIQTSLAKGRIVCNPEPCSISVQVFRYNRA